MAADLSFPAFHSDITVNTDASISVVETISADFGTEHHGIFRIIPYKFTTTNGQTASIPIIITAVTQDGQPAQFTKYTDSGSIIVKIGDPDVTMMGQHV